MAAMVLMEDVDSLDSYMKIIKKIPRITKEKEQELIKDYYEHNNLDSCKTLIEGNLRLVVFFARKYTNYRISIMDLIQEGNIGLMKSLKNFDIGGGKRFVSFAAIYIKHSILEFIKNNSGGFKITKNSEKKVFFNIRGMNPNTGSSLKYEDTKRIAEQLDVSESVVLDTHAKMFGVVPNTMLTYDDDEISVMDNIPDENNNIDAIAIDEEVCHNIKKMHQAIQKLNPRYQGIVKNRWLLEEPVTLTTLAEEQGCSLQRIAQVEKKAIQQLRTLMC